MDLKQKANELGFVSKIKLVHENLKSPDMGELEQVLYYLWLCELQKWLREVHKIDIMIMPWEEEPGCIVTYQYHVLSDHSDEKYDDKYILENNYDTYEKSLEIGLQESLKLINN